MAKFALLDESDRKVMDMLRADIKSKEKTLKEEFDGKQLRYWKYGGKFVENTCIILGSHVIYIVKVIDKEKINEIYWTLIAY